MFSLSSSLGLQDEGRVEVQEMAIGNRAFTLVTTGATGTLVHDGLLLLVPVRRRRRQHASADVAQAGSGRTTHLQQLRHGAHLLDEFGVPVRQGAGKLHSGYGAGTPHEILGRRYKKAAHVHAQSERQAMVRTGVGSPLLCPRQGYRAWRAVRGALYVMTSYPIVCFVLFVPSSCVSFYS